MPTVTIIHPDGTAESIAGTVSDEQGVNFTDKQEVGKMRRQRINVDRRDAQQVTLNQKRDRIQLGSRPEMRLVDVETGGSVWTLVAYSLEWDANKEPPTQGGETRTGSDADIVNGFIGDVSTWTAGTVNQQATSLSFTLSHAQQHEALRKVEMNVPGELQWTGETVDYLTRLGSDKSGSIELSASAGTIEDSIQITNRGRENDGTHFRVLGAHEGEAQLFVNLVPSGDPQTYENEVRYSTSRWNSAEDTDWDRWENKDVSDQATLETEAESLADEITEELIEAKTTVPGFVNIEVGDTVQVVKDDGRLNKYMRIHRLKEVAEGATSRYKVLLSTRTTARKDGSEDLRDIQRFNTAFQGSSVVIQAGGYLQPISSSTRATVPFKYPNIEFENNVELQVKGLPYRSYIGAAGHNHGISFSDSAVSENNSNYNQSVSDGSGTSQGSVATETRENITSTTVSAGGGSTTDAINVGTDISELYAAAAVYIKWEQEAVISNNCEIYLEDESGTRYSGNSYVYTTPIDGGLEHWISYVGIVPKNTKDENIRMYLENSVGENIETYLAHTQWFASGKHTHNISVSDTTISDSAVGFDPGVNLWDGIDQSPELTPSNVDVLVNGTQVASNIGSGEFETTVDLGGALNRGAWNEIELDADSRGFVQATVSARAYEQIGKQ